ncbi:GNAT family N-acetyltransferase [Cellulosimicrobium funkei]|nr:GNAT family N-acetyltransferase [Cellulosimicrobium funkei]
MSDALTDRAVLSPAEFEVPGQGSLVDWWPLFGLRLESGALELRTVHDGDLPAHLAAVNEGIHEAAGTNPFGPNRWSSAPAEDIARNAMHDIWRNRAETDRDRWTIQLGIWDHGATDHGRRSTGRLVGNIVVRAAGFPVTRTVDTGSWITRSAQGRGLGRRARAMALVLAFDHLGAEHATTECAAWNHGSRRVTESLGYEPQGSSVQDWGGEAVEVLGYRLGPERFVRPAEDVAVTGAAAVRHQLGIHER